MRTALLCLFAHVICAFALKQSCRAFAGKLARKLPHALPNKFGAVCLPNTAFFCDWFDLEGIHHRV